LAERLVKTFGDRLKSVILYGSAASGDHHAKYSDLNVLCVLKQVGTRELADSGPVVRWWRELGNPSPLLLGEAEVRGSGDCFPIEFQDIGERRRILYGDDVFAGLEIDPRFYRAQVEHDLRARLLRLRQKATGVLQEPRLLAVLLADSVSTFCVLFRHALALAGVPAAAGKREVLGQARERFGIDPGPFLTLLDLREEKIKPRDIHPQELLGAYIAEIQRVIDGVDQLESERGNKL
jgi:predicted nucleotidyltransferase